MASAHTVRSFDDDLRQIRSMIAQMGGLAEAQTIGAVEALTKRDLAMAKRIVSADKAIDQLEIEAEKAAVQLIARRAPLADDLREVISALKIASLIERVADYAKNIAKRTPAIAEAGTIQPMVIVPEMARAVTRMLKDVLDAYMAGDADKARQVWGADKEVDDLYNSLFRSLLTYMMEKPSQITPSTHLLFVAKNLERIGDHATNLAEIVVFNVTGEMMDPDRPKADATAYLTADKI
jgi:phosphate transport system protein